MPAKILLPLALMCLLAGCNMPAVAPKPPAFQDSTVTVRDWDGVAQQIADEMAARGLLPDPANPQSATQPRYPYYINVAAPDSPFLHEVSEQLQSEILHRGGTVTLSPVGAMAINLDVDVVRWGGRRYPGGLGTITGLATGTGILLANNGPLSPAAGFGVATGAGIVADAIFAATPRTNVEAVWQASAMMGDRLVFDIRRPIYVGEQDVPLHKSNTRLDAMSSPGAPATILPVRLRYDP